MPRDGKLDYADCDSRAAFEARLAAQRAYRLNELKFNLRAKVALGVTVERIEDCEGYEPPMFSTPKITKRECKAQLKRARQKWDGEVSLFLDLAIAHLEAYRKEATRSGVSLNDEQLHDLAFDNAWSGTYGFREHREAVS